MAVTVGINHVTVTTDNVDAMVDFHVTMFGGLAVFDSAGRDGTGNRGSEPGYPRMVIVEIGAGRYVKVVEGPTAPETGAGVERFGLAVESEARLRELREHLVSAGATVSDVERLPTQWVLAVTDPDGGLVQVCAHAR